jgi:hypothetical protein
MSQPGTPVSLVAPEASEATARRARVVTSADASPDSGEKGFNTRGAAYLHITVAHLDVGASCDWELWLWSDAAEMWCLYPNLGAAGTVSCSQSGADHPQLRIPMINGASRAWVKVDNLSGVTLGVQVWLASTAS